METTEGVDGGLGDGTKRDSDFFRSAPGRLAVIALCVVASVAVAEFVTRMQQKLYRATATIEVLPESLLRASEPAFVPAIVTDEKYLATYLHILTLPEPVLAAVTNAHLKDDPAFHGKSPQQIAAMADGRIECTRRRGLHLIDVSVTGTDPQTLDKLANALVEGFKQMQKMESKKLRDERKARLDDKITAADAGGHLARIDKACVLQGAQFSETTFELDFVALRARYEKLSKAIDDLNDDLASRELAVHEARRARNAVAGDESAALVLSIERDARVETLSRQIAAFAQEKERLLADGMTRLHPSVADAESKIAAAEQERKDLVRQAGDRLIRKYEADEVSRERLQHAKDATFQNLSAATAVKAKVDLCDADIAEYMAARKAAARELEVLQQAGADEKDAVVVVARAKEPDAPFAPSPGTNLAIGLAVGVLAGLLVSCLRE
jgi:uncharacterized protein involved in exopolysaccharide biosynthesis